MKLNQVNNFSLKRKDLKRSCYYQFTNLSDYIFIFEKEYPDQIIPIINKDSDNTISFEQYLSIHKDNINEQFVEVISIEKFSYNQEIYSLDTPLNKMKFYNDIKCYFTDYHKHIKNNFFMVLDNNHLEIYMKYSISCKDNYVFFKLNTNNATLFYFNGAIEDNIKFSIIDVTSIDYKALPTYIHEIKKG